MGEQMGGWQRTYSLDSGRGARAIQGPGLAEPAAVAGNRVLSCRGKPSPRPGFPGSFVKPGLFSSDICFSFWTFLLLTNVCCDFMLWNTAVF